MTAAPANGRLVDPTLFTDAADGSLTLVGSRCTHCGTTTFPAQGSCPKCTATAVDRVPLPTSGTLWAHTVQRFAPKTPYLGADVKPFRPYAVGYVDLGGQVLVETRIVCDDPAVLAVGLPLELVIETFHHDRDGAVATYAFTPASSAASGGPR